MRAVLVVLWAGFVLAGVFALVAIVITGRYPVFDFNVGVLRWSRRVSFYGCLRPGDLQAAQHHRAGVQPP